MSFLNFPFMNIALIGYGAMGQIVNSVAQEKGFQIKSIIDPDNHQANFNVISAESLKDIDVCIDFTNSKTVLSNVKKIAEHGKNIIMATTGWQDEIEEIKTIVKQHNLGFLYASNFSLGVNLFFKIVKDTAKIMNQFDDYDVYSYEMHHNRKKDAPSGTAFSLGNILLNEIKRKKKLVLDRPNNKIKQDEIHLASIRGGDIPGTHCVGFDSSADTIELKHTARNRKGFALGSLLAAQWLNGKKGFFTASDWLNF